MAAIVVQDEFVRVNTSEPDRKGVLDVMKQILAASTVHSDYMCFGPSTEQKILEEAYQGVSTQCAAQIALTNSEAQVPNLIQMTYISDEGLAKLKPTVRLSPKRRKVLILVSDSSTALCSSNRKGKLTKGDLTNEAMFTEFANRGLQTQSATTCVGSLELYDAFHASENEHNREVFTAYLHATLAVSRAEWLAECMQIAIRPLRRQYKHVEPNNAGNPAATKALRDWHAEKEKIRPAREGIPIRRAHTEITEDDKAWEQPDVAKAADLTTLPATPPPDKAIREDVPDFGPTTTVENIADCINDVVVQDAEGNVSYQPPSDVDLVDDGDYDVPIQSSMGRVIEDPTPKKAAPTRKSDQDEDILRREMFVDHSTPQGVASSSDSSAQEYFYNGVAHR
ncbi:NLRC3, partial [Symbiodinium microadriaticum]